MLANFVLFVVCKPDCERSREHGGECEEVKQEHDGVGRLGGDLLSLEGGCLLGGSGRAVDMAAGSGWIIT